MARAVSVELAPMAFGKVARPSAKSISADRRMESWRRDRPLSAGREEKKPDQAVSGSSSEEVARI